MELGQETIQSKNKVLPFFLNNRDHPRDLNKLTNTRYSIPIPMNIKIKKYPNFEASLMRNADMFVLVNLFDDQSVTFLKGGDKAVAFSLRRRPWQKDEPSLPFFCYPVNIVSL